MLFRSVTALVAAVGALSANVNQLQPGHLSDDAVFVEWANDYRHYGEIRKKVEKSLADAA